MPSSKKAKTSWMTEVTELTSLMALDSDSDSTICCLLLSQLPPLFAATVGVSVARGWAEHDRTHRLATTIATPNHVHCMFGLLSFARQPTSLSAGGGVPNTAAFCSSLMLSNSCFCLAASRSVCESRPSAGR